MYVHVFGSAGLDEKSDERSNSCLSTWEFTDIIVVIIHNPPIKPQLGSHAYAIELAGLLTSSIDPTACVCVDGPCQTADLQAHQEMHPQPVCARVDRFGHFWADTDQVSAYVMEAHIDMSKSPGVSVSARIGMN